MNEYGPQTEEIKTFLERVRNLTPEQADKLTSVRDVTWVIAWNEARDAVEDVSWNVLRKAVWNIPRDVVQGASWDVTRDAVLALLAKDKISEEHFNTLYGPWKSVMEK